MDEGGPILKNRGIPICLVLVLLLASAPLSAATVVERGIDVFTTTDNGKTFYDFAYDPIPAGFFCPSSAAFTGRVALRGLPIEAEIPGQLRGADTIIERLDDAVFDPKGEAETRIRFRALSLISSDPIQTACGAFHLYVTLDGEQGETTMQISRTHRNGGSFVAPLSVDARLRFVSVAGPRAQSLELTGNFTFPAVTLPWSFAGGPGAKQVGPVVVDTNGDLVAETLLPGTSNFAPGWQPDGSTQANYGCFVCEPETCHPYQGKTHCNGPILACGNEVCP